MPPAFALGAVLWYTISDIVEKCGRRAKEGSVYARFGHRPRLRHRGLALSIEQLFYQHNQTTVIGVAEARGVILLAAAQCGVPVFEYTPMQVKQAVTGYGKAVKKQVQEMTRVMLRLDKVPKPDDTADALAMAIAHCHCSRSRLQNLP